MLSYAQSFQQFAVEALTLKIKMDTVTSINPYTGDTLHTYTKHTSKEVDTFLRKAKERFSHWKKTSYEEREDHIKNVASELEKNKETYAKTMTLEMGKPLSQSIAEIEKCIWLCEYYINNAKAQLQDKIIETDAQKSFIRYEPLGVLLAVMPWNYPFWQVFRFAIPALMAGNVAVLKHASNVFGSALNIEKVFANAGLPEGCFTTLLVGSDAIKGIIENDIVKAVTLTGSGPAGASVASLAGKNIKKSVLELGGNNALVVFEDCDIDATIETCVTARFQNTGQSCIAGKRLLLAESIQEEFTEKLISKVKDLKSGDPLSKDTYVGTLAREDLAKDLESQVHESLKMGAQLKLGGKRCGAYYEPTIVSEVTEDMPMFQEETFGPALSITTFSTTEEAIALSNNSKFGLGVSLFSEDLKKMETLIPQFEEGAVFINELVKSDPRLPFGGVKESGYGRELSSQGIREFVNIKTVYIKK